MDFVPLQVKSSFSLLRSPIRINELVTTAKERGYSAIALTDKNVLYGAIDFYNAAKKAGIKPGTSFEDLPDDWVCPVCGEGKEMFEIHE